MKEFCFYKTPNNRRIVGVSNAVNIPFSVNPRLAYAPYLLLMSMAVEVPTAWAAVPIESPWAIGLPTCMIFIVLNPQMAPSKPTATTTAAVSDGIPPIALVTSMAIGVVTDLGANERMTSCEAPINLESDSQQKEIIF